MYVVAEYEPIKLVIQLPPRCGALMTAGSIFCMIRIPVMLRLNLLTDYVAWYTEITNWFIRRFMKRIRRKKERKLFNIALFEHRDRHRVLNVVCIMTKTEMNEEF